MDLRENLIIAERFRLVREVGRGGMGSVWLAHHLGLDVPCAIKFIDRVLKGHANLPARLEREARAGASLRSPHVVQVFDFGTWEGDPYIVMEYLEGENLAERLDRVGRLDHEATLRVVRHIARALAKAHSAGIVHRDLKPENIFLVADDTREIAKVFDFGVAQLARDEDCSREEGFVGTPEYMSPEQASGNGHVDYRSDLWSLAVIAFECLSGCHPFFGDTLIDVLAKIQLDAVVLPSQVVGDLPRELDVWWQKAVARDPVERFQSAQELADALAVALAVRNGTHVAATPRDARHGLPRFLSTRAWGPVQGADALHLPPAPAQTAHAPHEVSKVSASTATVPVETAVPWDGNLIGLSRIGLSRAWLAEPRHRRYAVVTTFTVIALSALGIVSSQVEGVEANASLSPVECVASLARATAPVQVIEHPPGPEIAEQGTPADALGSTSFPETPVSAPRPFAARGPPASLVVRRGVSAAVPRPAISSEGEATSGPGASSARAPSRQPVDFGF